MIVSSSNEVTPILSNTTGDSSGVAYFKVQKSISSFVPNKQIYQQNSYQTSIIYFKTVHKKPSDDIEIKITYLFEALH